MGGEAFLKARRNQERNTMADETHRNLSRREREIMDIIYAQGQATVTLIMPGMPDPPTRTAVRTLVRILEEKGHLKHFKSGREFVYQPTRPRGRAGQSALQRVVSTFFDGSLDAPLRRRTVAYFNRTSPFTDGQRPGSGTARRLGIRATKVRQGNAKGLPPRPAGWTGNRFRRSGGRVMRQVVVKDTHDG